MTDPERAAGPIGSRGATRVAIGIAVSRALGLVREVLIARFLGVGAWADVFRTALRGPNLLQNLLGEQTLSAAFIPVYSRMEEAGAREDGARFAGAVFGLLLAVVAGLVLVGEVLAEPLVAVLSSGYLGDAAAIAVGEAAVDRFPLAVAAVRWIFPMVGLLVLSAWTLAVLNSHRRFLLPYLAPALWNAAIIAALWGAGSGASFGQPGGASPAGILRAACVGALLGGALQFLVQLPAAWRCLAFFRPSLDRRARGVREAWGAFLPLVTGRGAVQLSSYLDHWLASFLRVGAQSALGFAQGLYLLPISLFGMSVAAAELPELARSGERDPTADRLGAAVRQAAFLAIPAAIGYLCFGYLVVRALFGGGSFGPASTWLVAVLLGAYAAGMPASIVTRQLNNLFYAAGRTRWPARAALERMALSAAAGTALMLWLDRYPVSRWIAAGPSEGQLHWGGVGLAVGATLGAWYELARVRQAAEREWPAARLPAGRLAALAGLALLAAALAALVWRSLPPLRPLATLAVVLAIYVVAYLAAARAFGVSELSAWLGRFSRRQP
ncbi:MAG: murein biosynthesis integral membrane protein MurJ [Thermoanaerobaculia bacterium]